MRYSEKIGLLLFVIAVSLGACKKKAGPTAEVAIINGCTGNGIDVFLNNKKLSAASDLPYLANSGYQKISAGAVSYFLFSPTSSSATPLGGSGGEGFYIQDNHYYSIFIGGTDTPSVFVVAGDDLSAPGAGMAKLRFVDLIPDSALIMNCFIGGKEIDSNIWLGATPYIEVPGNPSETTLLLLHPLNPSDSFVLTNQVFAAGQIYTIMLSGMSSAQYKLSVFTN